MRGDGYAGPLTKPARGTQLIERRRKRQQQDADERAQKQKAKARDGHQCRWPGCACKSLRLPLESAHLVDKSLGGSNDMSNLITVCSAVHRGSPSIHSKDLKVEPQTAAGANGPCDFYTRDASGRWQVFASERVIGVSVMRGAA